MGRKTTEVGTDRGLVLLAEDEVSVRGLVRKILERAGFTVLAAEDGARAWEIALREHSRLALLLTDVVMPGMYGTELADRVLGLRPELPVLFMSGYTDNDRLRRGALGPGQLFLEKPFGPAQLLDTVRRLLRAAGEPDPAAAGDRIKEPRS